MAVKTESLKPYNTGVYVGYPGTAAYNATMDAYVALVGAVPTEAEIFIDLSQPVSQWVKSSQQEAASLSGSKYGSTQLPVISVPLISTTSNGLTEAQNFANIASGADDSVWLGIVQAYKAQGYTTIDLRIGEEQNGNWYPWSVSTPALAQDYVAAWDHIADVVHSVAGITVNTIWNPCDVTTGKVATLASYPGDKYVDIIGADAYDYVYSFSLYDWTTHTYDSTLAQWEANPANLEHYWTYPDANVYHQTGTGQGFGLADAVALALSTGKPLALPEIGAGGGATSPSTDDPLFPQFLASYLLNAGVEVAFADIFDSGAYTFTDGSKPTEAAAWAAFVQALVGAEDPGPSASAGTTTVGRSQTINLGSQVAALIMPGEAGDTETITAVSVTLGTVALGTGGAITYTAPAGGTDTLTYTVTDQYGDTGTFSDTIIVNPGPTGGGGTIVTGNGQTVDLTSQLLGLINPGLAGDTETITAITSSLGAVTLDASGDVTFLAAAGGAGTLAYTVTDQLGDVSSFTTAIVADPGPGIAAGSTSVVQGTTTSFGAAIAALITPGLAGDIETITAVSAASGTATLGVNGAISYTAPSITGSDTITYTVADQYGDTATGTYAVTVAPAPTTSTGTISGSTAIFGPAYPYYGGKAIGIPVSLLDTSGNVIATTVSAGGWYIFRGVSAGTYVLQFAPTPGVALSPTGIANATTGVTAAFTLAPGQAYALPNENFVQTAIISGTVALSKAALSGMTISLLNAAGGVVATTTSTSTGAFSFNSVSNGSYQVLYTPPVGDALQTGPANSTTGLTSAVTVTAGQVLSLGAETLIPAVGTVQGKVYHLGSADPSWGTAQSGVGVALVNAAGTTVATAVSNGPSGYFQFLNVADDTYHYVYTLPAGEAFQAGSALATSNGVSANFVITAGSSQFTPTLNVVSSSNIFALDGAGAVALRGDGNYTVTGNASGGRLTLGNGNETVTLAGGGNTITVGAGNSNITALGPNNLIDVGPGMSFITADASSGNEFLTNSAGQGLETISGFTSGDILGLSQTLAGLNVANNLSNLGSYITAVTTGSDTTLMVDPTGGSGSPSAFAQLNGVQTTVAALVAGHNISLR